MDRPLDNYQIMMKKFVDGEWREQIVSVRDLAYGMLSIIAYDEENKEKSYSLQLEDFDDLYRLRSLLLRLSEYGGRFLSASDLNAAKEYAERLEMEMVVTA